MSDLSVGQVKRSIVRVIVMKLVDHPNEGGEVVKGKSQLVDKTHNPLALSRVWKKCSIWENLM